ncbi:hypothetical protein G5B31_09785 [Rhodobacter sp. SGA-6-6]|uniref:hypothetical protein n=1 Tax=Rhodobacter sp. SGA-6-6 TaxID=2710882 RepID=UPI0013EDBD61|nr:hypothetical protein [Rhodobacter sp. SGA-6-6]NGM45828.1 hypothetical protein [Rhodobacter sp. SGA-6-6]
MAARIGWAVLWILGLLALAVALATWRGALWPFDLRASLLMTASGLAGLARLWWWLWLLLASLALPGRALPPLWLAGLLAAVALHWTLGPARGLQPVAELGLGNLLALYAVPVALAVRIGVLAGIPLRLMQVKT